MNSLRKIRIYLWIVIVGLVVSGLTAFPLQTEVNWLASWLGALPGATPAQHDGLTGWIVAVRAALNHAEAHYPFIAYGTDWLAFAHLILAILFWGALKDPVRNIWIIQFGMVACILVVPLALIAGECRGIPFTWRLIDCAFGVIGLVPLGIAYSLTCKESKNCGSLGDALT